MHCSFAARANMNKENTQAANFEEPSVRITRARAKAFGASGGILPPSVKPSFKPDRKRVLQENSKRAASDESKASAIATAGLQHKRRAVLKDVANIFCDHSNAKDIDASKIQVNVFNVFEYSPISIS